MAAEQNNDASADTNQANPSSNDGLAADETQTGAEDAGSDERSELKMRLLAEGEKLEEGQMLTGAEMGAVVSEPAKDVIEASAAPVKPEVIEPMKSASAPVVQATESLSVVAVRHDLTEYAKNMAPGKAVNEKVGSFNQVKLFNLMLGVINRYSDDDFNEAMAVIIDHFRTGAKGVFAVQYVFRFMEHIELSPPRIKLFQRLLNMFIVMAEPKSRKAAMKQLNWQETLSGEITNDARNRVLKYFDVG